MSDDEQRTLEGLVVTTPEELERIFERVLAKHGLIQAARTSKWDRTYKGDAFWLEFRGHVAKLLHANSGIVAYRDLDQDLYFAKVAGIVTDRQWIRAVDQHLVPNKPHADDELEFVTFTLTPKSGRFLTVRSQLHCAIRVAANRQGRDEPGLIREVRTRYVATEGCDLCLIIPAKAQLVTPASHREKRR